MLKGFLADFRLSVVVYVHGPLVRESKKKGFVLLDILELVRDSTNCISLNIPMGMNDSFTQLKQIVEALLNLRLTQKIRLTELSCGQLSFLLTHDKFFKKIRNLTLKLKEMPTEVQLKALKFLVKQYRGNCINIVIPGYTSYWTNEDLEEADTDSSN